MSATVMAPVEAPMANTPSSLPDAIDQVRLVVVAGRRDGDHGGIS